MLTEPYFRIMRFGNNCRNSFILQPDYAHDRLHSIVAYHVIEKDLKQLFEYIDPRDGVNANTYSFRTYELLLRIATEFESNCKEILRANKYSKNGDLTMNDYKKIEKATKLSQYKVRMNIWGPSGKEILPLTAWANSDSPCWYQSYNKVKHNRGTQFLEANLNNVIKAAAGLFAILFSQFAEYVFDPFQETDMYNEDDEKNFHVPNGLFSISPYASWNETELYDLSSKNELNPVTFERFDFDIV